MGCGYHPRNPFGAERLIGLDIISDPALRNQNRFEYLEVLPGSKIPMGDQTIDSISGYDFIEHLGRGDGSSNNQFIGFMSEAHRVLRPNGVLFLVTPAYPSPAAFQDPTHVNFITDETVKYFLGPKAPANEKGYGFEGSFKLVTQFWMGPFSKIFSGESETSRKHFLRNFMGELSVKSIRRKISCLRNPTHLIWILTKI
jgi:SAM-dependent methyltransferase